MSSEAALRKLFEDSFKVDDPELKKELDEFRRQTGVGDYENYAYQRDQAISFQWGHNHDFGKWSYQGAMGDRHITLIAKLVDEGWLPENLKGKTVRDIGCWTGGTTLMLGAMGAEVLGVEEVPMYAEVAEHLVRYFGLESEVDAFSLYEMPPAKVDYVLCLGVLYHVSDLLVALRIMYDDLKPGGKLLFETEVLRSRELILKYEGPLHPPSDAVRRSRRGWNWFIPSTAALEKMCRDVGFDTVDMLPAGGRVIGVATKGAHRDMLRAGLSREL